MEIVLEKDEEKQAEQSIITRGTHAQQKSKRGRGFCGGFLQRSLLRAQRPLQNFEKVSAGFPRKYLLGFLILPNIIPV